MRGQTLKYFVIVAGFSIINAINFEPLVIARQGRIASGIAVKPGETNEFCYLFVKFSLSRFLTCGCFLFDRQYVVTSASCLVE